MKRQARPTAAYRAMKLLCALLGLVLAAMLSLTFAFQYLLNQIQTVPAAPMDLSTLASKLTSLTQTPDPEIIGGRGSSLVNILLVGQDRREGEAGQARSDSMILCTIHKDTDTITMTSFLRDLYLPIPGHGSNRINAAYSAGGMELLEQTLEENFSLHIDGCVEVDFSQFVTIIDLLGGIPMELRADEAAYINQITGYTTLTEGPQHLYGNEALVYSRIRSLDSDGDFSRTSRQRKVLTALVDACRQVSVTKLLPLLNQILPMITTDMNQGQILLLGMELLPHLSGAQINSQRIPADGTYRDETIDGMSVLVADLEESRALLRSSLTGG